MRVADAKRAEIKIVCYDQVSHLVNIKINLKGDLTRMKTRINRYDTVCMVVGYYDEEGGYREGMLENVNLKKIDKSITDNISLTHDITIHVVPSIEIRVFAKNRKDIETCLEIEGNPDHFKMLLDYFSKHDKSVNGEYIYTTFDLEERRKVLAHSPINF